ncbi:hypothetical protein [Epilithonimonas sp. UC225_85]|uniref:hypothetical protein n=1 Tax=Epilithonimonas sp. UC225_85 TaxID=3350167 RepID=UPI0036D3656F
MTGRLQNIDVLSEDRDKIARKQKYGSILFSAVILSGTVAFFFYIKRLREKEKIITTKYSELLEKFKRIDEVQEKAPEYGQSIKSIYNDRLLKS